MPRFDDYQYYHGAVLNVLAEHTAFTSFNKFPGLNSRNSYLLNHNTTLYIKHSTTEGLSWRFTFAPEHQEAIRKIFGSLGERTFIVLICRDLVCLLTYGEYAEGASKSALSYGIFFINHFHEIARPPFCS